MRKLKSKKIVVKIGTNTITKNDGTLDKNVMRDLVSQISKIKNNKRILIVTSGAIGAGMQELGLKSKPTDVITKQVCAGIGQSILMANYYAFFKKYNIKISQILLTYDDLKSKKTSKNLGNSLDKMLDLGVIPIINENDPISIDEIGPSFGDNDNMSALIASKLKADLLIILTSVDGLFNKDPSNKDAVLIKEVRDISKKIEAMGGKSSSLGVGGMKTKLQAAKKATSSGCIVIISNGKQKGNLVKVVKGEEVGTIFYPKNYK